MQHNKTTLLLSLLLLFAFACTEDIPDLELGRYEYAGIDGSKNWRFFRVENNGVYREVSTKATGLGELKQYSLCDENLFEQSFYDCGAYPSSDKPYLEMRENEIEMRVLANWQIKPEMVTLKAPYKIVGDSLLIESNSSLLKFSKSNGAKQKMFEATWDVSFHRRGLFALNPVVDQLTEQQRLHRIATKEKLQVGDTLVYLLFRERYVKQ